MNQCKIFYNTDLRVFFLRNRDKNSMESREKIPNGLILPIHKDIDKMSCEGSQVFK